MTDNPDNKGEDLEKFFNDPNAVFIERGIHDYRTNLQIREWDYENTNTSGKPFDLDGKKILVVGGGKSPIARQLRQYNYRPEIIVNVDKYTMPTGDYATERNTKLVREDFLTAKIENDLFDEVWALFSLPCYCKTNAEAGAFFKKATLALAPNGHLRIAPINHKYDVVGGECICVTKSGRGHYRIFDDDDGFRPIWDKFASDISNLGANTWVSERFNCARAVAPPDKHELDEWLAR
jgi:hypothetical protein